MKASAFSLPGAPVTAGAGPGLTFVCAYLPLVDARPSSQPSAEAWTPLDDSVFAIFTSMPTEDRPSRTAQVISFKVLARARTQDGVGVEARESSINENLSPEMFGVKNMVFRVIFPI